MYICPPQCHGKHLFINKQSSKSKYFNDLNSLCLEALTMQIYTAIDTNNEMKRCQ